MSRDGCRRALYAVFRDLEATPLRVTEAIAKTRGALGLSTFCWVCGAGPFPGEHEAHRAKVHGSDEA